ncbi:unnamed protein product [Protopolystoma xenopodis]|uniref:Uncharacterized protein n=1 Tax=Protopolystoma xenopodis TaxID=117903 RepID=A0A448WCW4_9PLAT|nr:unnamed protein product [Protopolystoma xenopodis]
MMRLTVQSWLAIGQHATGNFAHLPASPLAEGWLDADWLLCGSTNERPVLHTCPKLNSRRCLRPVMNLTPRSSGLSPARRWSLGYRNLDRISLTEMMPCAAVASLASQPPRDWPANQPSCNLSSVGLSPGRHMFRLRRMVPVERLISSPRLARVRRPSRPEEQLLADRASSASSNGSAADAADSNIRSWTTEVDSPTARTDRLPAPAQNRAPTRNRTQARTPTFDCETATDALTGVATAIVTVTESVNKSESGNGHENETGTQIETETETERASGTDTATATATATKTGTGTGTQSRCVDASRDELAARLIPLRLQAPSNESTPKGSIASRSVGNGARLNSLLSPRDVKRRLAWALNLQKAPESKSVSADGILRKRLDEWRENRYRNHAVSWCYAQMSRKLMQTYSGLVGRVTK